MTKLFFLTLSAIPAAALALSQAAPQGAAGLEHYEKKIRPLFAEHCYACHGPKQQLAGLRLDRAAGMTKGGNRGPLFVAGQPEQSVLLKAVGYTDIHLRMPPKAKLKDEEIAAIAEWVKMGAPMPEDKRQSAVGSRRSTAAASSASRPHWAYQPVLRPAVPAIQSPKLALSGANGSKIQNPIDSFLLAEMARKGLKPAPLADRRTLIRRVTFDLTGLPPTPAEVETLLKDGRPDAWERLVDRLLASPRYGERWGRHWLDLVRYSETLGHEFDYELPNAWRYRDYVIRAFNADVPYDRFVMEHIAGDLLPDPRRNPADGSNESVIGTAFWWMGEGKHSPVDVRQEQADRMDNQIDVFGKAFIAQTLACARCHDHKFDPIPTRDYYALAGYLRSSRYEQAQLDAPGRISEKARALDKMRSEARVRFIETLSATPVERDGAAALARAKSAIESAGDIGADHPLYAIKRLSQPSVGQASPPATAFSERAAALRQELRQRDLEARQAAAKTILFEDFEAPGFGDWRSTGDAFGTGPTRGGELRAVEQDNPKSKIQNPKFLPVPAGLAHSGLSSNQLEGALRSKSFTIEQKYILVRAAGRDSRIQVVLDGFQIIRDPIYGPCKLDLNDDRPDRLTWRVMDMSLWKGRHAYIELIDCTVPTLSHRPDGALERPSRGWVAVDEIRFSDTAAPPPAPVDPANLAVLDGAPPASLEALAARYQDLFYRAACSIGDEGARDHKYHSLAVALGMTTIPVALTENYEDIEASIPPPTYAPGLTDGPGEDEEIFLRGNYKTPGGKAPRGVPAVCLGAVGSRQSAVGEPQSKIQNPKSKIEGSGRLDLARRLVSRQNPLVARVIVNRVWQHHFGEGIVRTPDDFGRMGQRPTHPALLDWLAAGFQSGSYGSHKSYMSHKPNSLKALHRLILTSEAYRRSSVPGALAAKVDPQNKLLSHMPVRRLEAEAIRDSILAVSGGLNEKMYGPGVLPHLTPFMEGRGRPESGPLDGDGRRSIYIAVRRNFLTPMFLAFDYPVPFSCMGRRSVSNVPAQALSLMNGPFVQQQAKRWAERLLEGDRSVGARIRLIYETAFSRPPSPGEENDALAFLGADPTPQKWTDLCHVIFNVKEFIFVR